MHSAAASARACRWRSARRWPGSAAKTVCLVGDGGLMVNVGELATAVQENANVMIVLMNDQCYGVIRNIQDAQYGGRRCYVDLHQPDFAQFCESLKLTHYRIKSLDQADDIIREGHGEDGPGAGRSGHAVGRLVRHRVRGPAGRRKRGAGTCVRPATRGITRPSTSR